MLFIRVLRSTPAAAPAARPWGHARRLATQPRTKAAALATTGKVSKKLWNDHLASLFNRLYFLIAYGPQSLRRYATSSLDLSMMPEHQRLLVRTAEADQLRY
jgi:hypothetical protein